MSLNQQSLDEQDSNKNTIYITKSKLPACCPPKDQAHWNQHPRVYIELNNAGQANCPYCGNHFVLQND